VPITSHRDADGIRLAFMQDYERRYGHVDLKASVELQALHLSAFARLKRPEIARLLRAPGGKASKGQRAVYFAETGLVQAEVFDRYALAPGFTVTGPAIIEEYGSTTVVWPGDRLEIGALREIRITCNGA
jgi:N-methylhydantoinase A